MDGLKQSKGWGDVAMKEPDEEEIRQFRLLKWVTDANQRMRDERIPIFERKNIKNHMQLAIKHQFWDQEPIRKFLTKAPEKDGFLLKDSEMKAENFQGEQSSLP